jgi:hypothetical protein
MVEMKLEAVIAVNANPARIVTAEGKVRTYDMSGRRNDTDSPWRGRQRFDVLKEKAP